MKQLLDIYFTFMRVGGFTFGGGYAMLPMLTKEVVEKKKWITSEELLDYYTVSQCIPGIIAVNTATFVGNRVRGTLGGFMGAAGMVTPSIVIITIVAMFLQSIMDIPLVESAFAGVRVAVAALVLGAVIKLWNKSVKDIFTTVVFLLTFIVQIVFAINPVFAIVTAAVSGIVYKNLILKEGT